MISTGAAIALARQLCRGLEVEPTNEMVMLMATLIVNAVHQDERRQLMAQRVAAFPDEPDSTEAA